MLADEFLVQRMRFYGAKQPWVGPEKGSKGTYQVLFHSFHQFDSLSPQVSAEQKNREKILGGRLGGCLAPIPVLGYLYRESRTIPLWGLGGRCWNEFKCSSLTDWNCWKWYVWLDLSQSFHSKLKLFWWWSLPSPLPQFSCLYRGDQKGVITQ